MNQQVAQNGTCHKSKRDQRPTKNSHPDQPLLIHGAEVLAKFSNDPLPHVVVRGSLQFVQYVVHLD